MALFHLSVTQTKRSAGQSAIASAAYRAGERLYSEYYGEYSDYTRKGGVICSDILLPSHAPPEFADRQTLWNAVEKAERGKQPNTEPGIVLYEYAINEAESFEIMITQSDNRVYFDTENTKIEPFDKGGVTGYFFQKDGMSYICFERDGCFFSVYGSIDTDELAKIAASITKK